MLLYAHLRYISFEMNVQLRPFARSMKKKQWRSIVEKMYELAGEIPHLQHAALGEENTDDPKNTPKVRINATKKTIFVVYFIFLF